jgi:molecular chaperone GrpE
MIDEGIEPNEPKQTINRAADGPANDASEDQAASLVIEDFNLLRTKAEERDKFLDLLQRTRADFENYQKRVHRDLEAERKYAFAPLVKELLPAIDNLERALAAVKAEDDLSQGVRLVRTQLLDGLKRHGVTRIEADGQPFDPHLHQAVMQRPEPGQPPNVVVQVLQSGYQLHDRVLRPCSVIVSQ